MVLPLTATGNGGAHGGNGSGNGGANGGCEREATMGELLVHIFQTEGIEGLYRGCGAQIFTAISKSGVMLTAKEKIAAFAMALLLVLGLKKPRLK